LILPVKHSILYYNRNIYWCAETYNGLPTLLVYVKLNEKTKNIEYIENSLTIAEMLVFNYDVLKLKCKNEVETKITKIWNNSYGLTEKDENQIINKILSYVMQK
jgi:hypothetical protein